MKFLSSKRRSLLRDYSILNREHTLLAAFECGVTSCREKKGEERKLLSDYSRYPLQFCLKLRSKLLARL